MGCAPSLPYTLGLLPFGLALARFFPCTKSYKRVIVGTSTLPYFVSCTQQHVRCYIGSYTPRLMRLLVSNTRSPRVKKTIQVTFVIKSGAMCLILGACSPLRLERLKIPLLYSNLVTCLKGMYISG
jgi:hypothetical protein